MKDLTRFQSAVATARPRGARVIEAYSPKLGRRLQCFGELAFAQWICLEADPAIQTFCERPVTLDLGEGKRLADFWARSDDGETLLLVDDECQASTIVIGSIEYRFAPYHLPSWLRHDSELATGGKCGACTVSAESTLAGYPVSIQRLPSSVCVIACWACRTNAC